MNDPEFWSDKKTSDEAMREAKSLRARWEPLRALESRLADAGELLTMARAEDDATVLADVATELEVVEAKLAEQETATLFSSPDDARNAIISIHSGAGGTESMDWAEMLHAHVHALLRAPRFPVRRPRSRRPAKKPASRARRWRSTATTRTGA